MVVQSLEPDKRLVDCFVGSGVLERERDGSVAYPSAPVFVHAGVERHLERRETEEDGGCSVRGAPAEAHTSHALVLRKGLDDCRDPHLRGLRALDREDGSVRALLHGEEELVFFRRARLASPNSDAAFFPLGWLGWRRHAGAY